MQYPNRYNGRDEVKVAVLADQMRANEETQPELTDLIWGCAAIASACAFFLTIH